MKQNINQQDELERLIDKMLKKKEKMSGRDFIKLVFLSGWDTGKRKTLQQVCEEIDKVYRDLDMGKTIPIFIQRLKEKFQGEEK